MTSTKRKIETSTPIGGKLMADAMRNTRTSRRLVGLNAQTTKDSSSGAIGKVTTTPIVVEKEGMEDKVYIPYWNLSKTNQLTFVDEKKGMGRQHDVPRCQN